MKKFMTVLLVIAVMFTFSFSTAFAATDAEKATALTDAKAVAEKVIANYYSAAMEIVVKDNLGYSVAKDADVAAAWAAVDVQGQLATYINEKYLAEAANNAFTQYVEGATAADYSKKVFGLTTGAVDEAAMLAEIIKTIAGPEALKNMYEADRAEILSALDKVDYSVYSATETNAAGKTYLALAEEKIAEAKKNAEELAIYDLARYSEAGFAGNLVAYAIPALEAHVNTYVEAQKYAGTPYETGLYLVKGVATSDKVEADKLADAATIAEAKAAIQKLYADYLKTPGADKDFAADYVTIYNYLAEEGIITAADLATQGNIGQYVAGYKATLANAISDVEDLEAYAAKYAAEKDATGAYVRDAEAVNKLVAKAKLGTYAAAVGVGVNPEKVLTVAQAEAKIAAMSIDSDAAELAFAKEVAKANLEDAKASIIKKFYALEAAKVEEAYAKTLAKIEEATTVDKVKAIKTDAVTLKGSVLNAEEVDAKVSFASGAPSAAKTAVQAYVTYSNTGKTVLNNEYILADATEIEKAIKKIYGEAGARTAAEMKAVTIDPAAVAAELTTVGTVADAKAAAEAAVKAIPTTVKEADKDAVVAAYDAIKAYTKVGGALSSTLQAKYNNAVVALKTDMVKNFAIAVAQADKTDLAAMKALQAEFDAANKMVGTDKMFATPKFDDSKVVAAIKAIKAAELKAVEKAINAIPVNVTADDKAVVEAARAAYDAYVAEWTVYEDFNDCYAAGEVTKFRDLALAEAALGLNDNSEEIAKAAQIAAIEGIKIKANSSAKKGSITVKWTVDEEVEGVKYQVYKSTKAQTGYKKSITTSKTSFKNTKNLKKGTRYFYKVRAIGEVDGVTYYSDWSNKANRIAK